MGATKQVEFRGSEANATKNFNDCGPLQRRRRILLIVAGKLKQLGHGALPKPLHQADGFEEQALATRHNIAS